MADDLTEITDLFLFGGFPEISQSDLNEINEAVFLEQGGWMLDEEGSGVRNTDYGIYLSKKDLTDSKGLKFGNDDSRIKLEGARYFYLLQKYNLKAQNNF